MSLYVPCGQDIIVPELIWVVFDTVDATVYLNESDAREHVRKALERDMALGCADRNSFKVAAFVRRK